MIRINLLPVREARRKAGVRQQLMLLAVSVVGALVVVTLFHQVVRSGIDDSRQRIATLRSQLDQFKPQEAQVAAFKEKKAEIEQKLAVIEQLERSRSGPVHLLDELASRTPERMWLTDLKADGPTLELRGMSLDPELVADFLMSLNRSPFFAAVELQETELKKVDDLKLNTFRVHANLVAPSEPEPAAGAAPAAVPAPPAALPAAASR